MSRKRISVKTVAQILEILWPNFVEINGCIYAAFQCGGGPITELSDGKTETECFVNHTHVFDEFQNRATIERREVVSDELMALDCSYDVSHPDFAAACEIGRNMARMWATKLKLDFPHDRFRVYYTQYDNPIVRFHKVRTGEAEWLSNEGLRSSINSSFTDAIIYDTDRLDKPIIKGKVLPV